MWISSLKNDTSPNSEQWLLIFLFIYYIPNKIKFVFFRLFFFFSFLFQTFSYYKHNRQWDWSNNISILERKLRWCQIISSIQLKVRSPTAIRRTDRWQTMELYRDNAQIATMLVAYDKSFVNPN